MILRSILFDIERYIIASECSVRTSVDILLKRLSHHNLPTTREQLEELVSTNDKKRFSLSEDGLRIRANLGHSLPVELQLELKTPPKVLFHGTADRFLDSIRETGLEKRSRQHVHLSEDQKTDHMVGARHGKPVILEVQSQQMHAQGYEFYLSENGVWLTDHVPSQFVTPMKSTPSFSA